MTGSSQLRTIRREMSIQNHDQLLKSPPVLPQTGTIRADGFDSELPGSQPKRAFLTVIRGRADLGVLAFIEGRAVLGRDPECEFPLLDHRVSRRHATIMPLDGDRYLIQDLGSTNGTRVGGSLIAGPHLLQDGDKILLGDTVIRFSLADEIDIDFQNEVAMLVGTDPLTGLPSKRRFDEALEFALQSAKQAGSALAVLMMDMDGVKRINDTHGHLFGAHVIGETGRLIARVLAARGRACRFGGDEFSAFLPGHDLTAAFAIAEQIRSAVETAAMAKDGIALEPTISIGVACYPESGHELLDLISRSDKALYRAKREARIAFPAELVAQCGSRGQRRPIETSRFAEFEFASVLILIVSRWRARANRKGHREPSEVRNQSLSRFAKRVLSWTAPLWSSRESLRGAISLEITSGMPREGLAGLHLGRAAKKGI